jgi:hypothetical protein
MPAALAHVAQTTTQAPTNKSFLLLFSKKEALPSLSLRLNLP